VIGPAQRPLPDNIYTTREILAEVKVKVKFALQQATKAQRWSRGIALLSL